MNSETKIFLWQTKIHWLLHSESAGWRRRGQAPTDRQQPGRSKAEAAPSEAEDVQVPAVQDAEPRVPRHEARKKYE